MRLISDLAFFIMVIVFLSFLIVATSCCPKDGKDGAPGVVGPVGPGGSNGNDGNDGAIGPTGTAGTPGTLATFVQFCPGATTYPSTFVEVGICVNSNLYAVYSANDGFLTLIPPGRYRSNAIGSRCDFTVLTNCEIQP